jgi:hypothetical protein
MLNRLLVPPCSYPHWTDNINNKLGQRVKCELVEKFELPSMHSLLESNTMSWADISRTCNCHSLIVSLESFQTNLKAKTNYYCCRAKFEPIILLKECATFLFHTYFHPHTHTHVLKALSLYIRPETDRWTWCRIALTGLAMPTVQRESESSPLSQSLVFIAGNCCWYSPPPYFAIAAKEARALPNIRKWRNGTVGPTYKQ